MFQLKSKILEEMKEFIMKLINSIETVYLKNTCHVCKYSTYRLNNFKKHLTKTKHITNINAYNNNLEIIKLKEEINITNSNINSNNKYINNSVDNSVDNSTNTFNFNINLVPFGKENIDNISHKKMLRILLTANSAITELIKHIHCNKERPENLNIYMSNIKNETVKTYNGEIWNNNEAKIVIQKLVSNMVTNYEIIFKKCKKLKKKNELDDPDNIFTDDFIRKCEQIYEENDFVVIAKEKYNEIKYLLCDIKELKKIIDKK